MAPAIRPALLGDPSARRRLLPLIAISAVVTFLAYASDVFAVSGGVVWIPGHAALVGLLVATIAGYLRAGLLLGWIAPDATLFAFQAEWAVFGFSSRTLGERLAFLFDPEGLAVFALMAVVIGSLGYGIGTGLAWIRETYS